MTTCSSRLSFNCLQAEAMTFRLSWGVGNCCWFCIFLSFFLFVSPVYFGEQPFCQPKNSNPSPTPDQTSTAFSKNDFMTWTGRAFGVLGPGWSTPPSGHPCLVVLKNLQFKSYTLFLFGRITMVLINCELRLSDKVHICVLR